MRARIYQPARTAMQSGTAKTHQWVLEFAPASTREVDPLMGWTSSDDTQAQVRLRFDSREAALAYAAEKGIEVDVTGPKAAQADDPAARLWRELRHRPQGRLDALRWRIVIAEEHPLTPDLELLFQRHTADMHADTPPESIHMMDKGALAAPGIRFFVLRDGGQALGDGGVQADRRGPCRDQVDACPGRSAGARAVQGDAGPSGGARRRPTGYAD